MRKVLITILAVSFVLIALGSGPALADSEVEYQVKVETEKSKRPQLGVYLQELDDKLRQKFDYDGDGILVTDVIEESGAEMAGLDSGDILIEFDGTKLTSVETLRKKIRDHDVGDKVNVKYVRDGSTKNANVELLGRKDANIFVAPDKWVQIMDLKRPWIGIEMQEVNSQLADYFKVDSGILVTRVVEDSPAEKAGLKAGDIVVGWNDVKITAQDDLYDALDEAEAGQTVDFKVVREGKSMTKSLELGEKENADFKTYGFDFEEGEDGETIIRMKDWHMNIPPMPDMPMPHFDKEDMADFKDSMEDYKDAMKDYKEEMKALQEEMKALKQELQEMKDKNAE